SRRTGYAGYALLDRYARNLPGVDLMSISTYPSYVTTYPNGERTSLYLKHTDGVFWQILDFDFLEGGPYTVEDDRAGNLVAVVNDATRRRLFGNASALGHTIEIDGQAFRIVGVVANVPILRLGPFSD